MRQRRLIRRQRRIRRRLVEEHEPNLTRPRSTGATADRLSAFYAAGPALGLRMDGATASDSNRTARAPSPAEDSAAGTQAEPLPLLSGKGAAEHAVAFSNGNILRLRGRTDAQFDGGAFHTEDVTVTPGTGCRGCSGRECI